MPWYENNDHLYPQSPNFIAPAPRPADPPAWKPWYEQMGSLPAGSREDFARSQFVERPSLGSIAAGAAAGYAVGSLLKSLFSR